jgi:antitoxin (DNA-binding transcriptional repressor) of toxin-antitoxin stability system
MTTVTLEAAQHDLPSLIKRALAGEEIVIGTPGNAVLLTPAQHHSKPTASYRGRGALKDQLVVGPEFFEPLDDAACGTGDPSGAS